MGLCGEAPDPKNFEIRLKRKTMIRYLFFATLMVNLSILLYCEILKMVSIG